MNTLLTIVVIGISLSMDAFSLSLIYGTLGIVKKDRILLSLIVGIYHFMMPLIGLLIGSFVVKILSFKLNILMCIIFLIIGIEMIYSSFKNEDNDLCLNIIGYLLFGLSVSIDSFTTGIGLKAISNNYLQVSITFALVSSFFTFIGLNLGTKLSNKFGKVATIIGGLLLIVLSIYYFFN